MQAMSEGSKEQMKKIYICGKITGEKDYRAKFLAEENRLFSLGYDPVNPVVLVRGNTPWDKAMRTVLSVMLRCDGISLLPDWKNSKGAKIEAALAADVGIEVRPCKEWR